MYPEVGFTKGQVIDYYTQVARYILPHLKARPITMKRFPDGINGQYFYEKDAPSFTHGWIKTYPIPRTSEKSTINYILINDLPALVWSANMANLEIHPFLAKAPNVEVPTMVVFDLDPGEEANILKSCEVAFLVKAVLEKLKLKSLVKVSGSKGIHLHVPLNTKVTYEITKSFAQSIAQFLEREHPDLIVSEMAKVKRKGKVFIDWSQNSEHKSTVAVYSLRAKGERPFVAIPVTWNELKKAVKKDDASWGAEVGTQTEWRAQPGFSLKLTSLDGTGRFHRESERLSALPADPHLETLPFPSFRRLGVVAKNKRGSVFASPFEMGPFEPNYFTLIAICFGLASSALGTCISRMPSRYVALIPSCFTVCGR